MTQNNNCLQLTIAIGVQELIKTQSANIHRRQDWLTILQLLIYASLLEEYRPAIESLPIAKMIGLSTTGTESDASTNTDENNLRIKESSNRITELHPYSLTTSIHWSSTMYQR